MATTVGQRTDAVRPFSVAVPREALDDLRRRLAATRWPSRELVEDRSQGAQLAAMQAVCGYWASGYDVGRVEARLNALPQFVTEIDGVEIHFLHVRSPHDDALPLIMTHGWPGSVMPAPARVSTCESRCVASTACPPPGVGWRRRWTARSGKGTPRPRTESRP